MLGIQGLETLTDLGASGTREHFLPSQQPSHPEPVVIFALLAIPVAVVESSCISSKERAVCSPEFRADCQGSRALHQAGVWPGGFKLGSSPVTPSGVSERPDTVIQKPADLCPFASLYTGEQRVLAEEGLSWAILDFVTKDSVFIE